MEKLRPCITYIILWLMTIIASIEFGIIYSTSKDIPRRVTKLEINQQELIGEVQSHKTMFRRISKGERIQIPEGR